MKTPNINLRMVFYHTYIFTTWNCAWHK